MARKTLLVCGILSSLVYIGADVVAAGRWEQYSYTSQMISELMAIDTPTRPMLVVLFTISNLLATAFGVGVWLSARPGRRALRVAAWLFVAYGVVGEFALLFCPMHMREAAKTATDTRHIIATAALVLITFLYIGFAAAARGKTFRLYSIATVIVLFIFGALSGLQGPRIDQGLPTPGFGLMERVNIYASFLWMAVFALALLRGREGAAIAGPGSTTAVEREIAHGSVVGTGARPIR